jgi:DNA (cytosine-5)-methyltransferase 1
VIEYGSVCSGIEAATVAWHALGWRPRWFAEIDAFPSAVLAHRWPGVPNLGDFTKIGGDGATLDLLVGGTPCQSFSVAGLRGGMDDERGQLALEYLRLARRTRARWLVWENVPGVLSSDGGRDFGAFLGGLVELGYGFAYRVLDAQFFGVPQRRRRVFVVGYLGDWRPAAAVLFERACLRGDPPPSRASRQDVAGTLGGSSQSGGFRTTDLDNSGAFVVAANAEGDEGLPFLTRSNVGKILNNQTPLLVMPPSEPFVFEARVARNGRGAPEDMAPPLKAQSGKTGKGDSAPLVVIPFDTTQLTHPENRSNPQPGDPSGPLASTGHPPTIAFTGDGVNADPISAVEGRTYTHEGDHNFRLHNVVKHPVAFKASHYTRNKDGAPSDVCAPLTKEADRGDQDPIVLAGSRIRRLTPRECERLQGFPNDYTLIPSDKRNAAAEREEMRAWLRRYEYRDATDADLARLATDSPRYKALGNSMAVPVMRWIGERIGFVEALRAKKSNRLCGCGEFHGPSERCGP